MRARLICGLSALLASCASVPSRTVPLSLAITVDDLPLHGPLAPEDTPVQVARDLATTFRLEAVPAKAFVNGHWTEEQQATAGALQQWRQAQLTFGNHGWAHRNLDEMDSASFERELLRNEPLLAGLQPTGGWHWFRYPFLAEGKTPEKRLAGRAVLARHGYRVAGVTMDFSDWQWTAPYARCREKGDTAGIAKLEQSYLAAAAEAVTYSRSLARRVYGRDIPYILLMHSGALDARMLPRLLDLYRKEGFRFVTLEEATRDPAYSSDLHPERIPEPQDLEGRAAARGIPLPQRQSYTALLEAICR